MTYVSFGLFRDELGLPDRGSPVFEGQHSPTLVLALFSKLFAQPQPDWPPQARATGFAFYDGRRELEMPRELSRFLDDGPPAIVFTLGSSAVWVARDFYHESIAAAKLLSRRAVLLIGDDRNRSTEALPAAVIAVNYARDNKHVLSVRGGGHSGPGFGTNDGGFFAIQTCAQAAAGATSCTGAGPQVMTIDDTTSSHAMTYVGKAIAFPAAGGLFPFPLERTPFT